MQTKYKINLPYSDKIEPVTVVSETACYVTVLEKSFFSGKLIERKTKKGTGLRALFDTWEQAKAALVESLRAQVEHATERLARLNQRLLDARALEPPAEEDKQ